MVIGLAVLVVAHGAVYFGNRLGGHQFLQEQHVLGGNTGIHQKVRTGKTEQDTDFIGAEQNGIHVHPTCLIVQHR